MKGLILSFQLFSRIPIAYEVPFERKYLRQALYFMPFVGLTIGLLTLPAVFLLYEKSSLLAAVMGLIIYFILSGGLHLDGLSDVADGFLANVDAERTIEIMHDPQLGLFGNLSLTAYSFLKVAAIEAMGLELLYHIPLTHFLSRLFVLYVIYRGSLGPSGGFGRSMKEALASDKWIYLYFLFMIAGLLIWKIWLLIPLIVMWLVCELMIFFAEKKIQGLTGDVYGATIEILECVVLLVLLAVNL